MAFTLNMEWVETYFSNRLYSDNWNNADSTNKSQSVVMATNMVLASFDFVDDSFFINDDNEEDCLDQIKNGICEQAIYLLSIDPTAVNELLTMGMASGSAAGASATFSKELVAQLICDSAKMAIGEYGSFVDYSGSGSRCENYSLIW